MAEKSNRPPDRTPGADLRNTISSDVILPAARPFAEGALTYRRKGWTDVFPVGTDREPYAKAPVPKGVTGYEAGTVSYLKIEATVHAPAGGRNIGLRMPRHIVALDVDEYEGKGGGATVAKMEADLGPLPATYRNTARNPETSGHRVYRLPVGMVVNPRAERTIADTYGPHVEILHRGHRYAVVWPSVHLGVAGRYRWYAPDGTAMEEPPAVVEVPLLPDAWLPLLAVKADSPAAISGGGGNLRRAAAPSSADEAFDVAGKVIRRSVAEIRTSEAVDNVLAMAWGNVNKTLGGAGIWLGRMAAAGLLTVEQAVELIQAAAAKNGKHSDDWNRRNGRRWTLHTRTVDAISQGLNQDPYTVLDDHQPVDVFGQLMRKVAAR